MISSPSPVQHRLQRGAPPGPSLAAVGRRSGVKRAELPPAARHALAQLRPTLRQPAQGARTRCSRLRGAVGGASATLYTASSEDGSAGPTASPAPQTDGGAAAVAPAVAVAAPPLRAYKIAGSVLNQLLRRSLRPLLVVSAIATFGEQCIGAITFLFLAILGAPDGHARHLSRAPAGAC